MGLFKAILLTGLSLVSETAAVKLLATHFSGKIVTLDWTPANATSGSLAITSQATGCGVTPAWLYLDESTRTLYCFDESWQPGGGVITQYSVASGDSTLTLTGTAPTTGNSVHGSLYGGPDGKGFVVTAEYSPSTITAFKLPITNASVPLQKHEFTMDAPGPRPDRQDKPHPHAAFTDPTGAFIVVPDLGADLTRIFRIDNTTGLLTPCPAIATLPGDGPRHGVFHQSGPLTTYYSLNEVSSSVGVYAVSYPSETNTTTGCLSLTLRDTLSTYGPDVPLGNVTVKSAEIRIAGSFLYASNRNDSSFGFEQDSIAVFRIGKRGALAFDRLVNSHAYYPRSFAFNRAGTFVAVGGQTTANVAILARDGVTGVLGPVVANVEVSPRGTYGEEDGLSSVIWDE